MIADLEGPSFISRTVRTAVWTGDARDTKPVLGLSVRLAPLAVPRRLCRNDIGGLWLGLR